MPNNNEVTIGAPLTGCMAGGWPGRLAKGEALGPAGIKGPVGVRGAAMGAIGMEAKGEAPEPCGISGPEGGRPAMGGIAGIGMLANGEAPGPGAISGPVGVAGCWGMGGIGMLAKGEAPAAEDIIGPEGLEGWLGCGMGAMGMLAKGEAPGMSGPLETAGGWAALRFRFSDGGAEPTKSACVGIAGGIPGGRRGGRLPAGRVPGAPLLCGALDPGSSGSAGAKGLGAAEGIPGGCAWLKGDCRESGATPWGRRALVWLAIMLGSLPRGSCTIRGSWGETGP